MNSRTLSNFLPLLEQENVQFLYWPPCRILIGLGEREDGTNIHRLVSVTDYSHFLKTFQSAVLPHSSDRLVDKIGCWPQTLCIESSNPVMVRPYIPIYIWHMTGKWGQHRPSTGCDSTGFVRTIDGVRTICWQRGSSPKQILIRWLATTASTVMVVTIIPPSSSSGECSDWTQLYVGKVIIH